MWTHLVGVRRSMSLLGVDPCGTSRNGTSGWIVMKNATPLGPPREWGNGTGSGSTVRGRMKGLSRPKNGNGWGGARNLGRESEMGEDPADHTRILNGREQAHAAARDHLRLKRAY